MSNSLRKKLRRPRCNANRPDSPAVQESLDCLLHFHMEHTNDKITRFDCGMESDSGERRTVVVYVISDADCIANVREAVRPEFPNYPEPVRVVN